ncbi:glycosyltransferase family 2 protein [Microbacterium sp. P04]|uniref:glycosyltransferase family 2 protein n=1 Tax=Microbacterium sp. P04 TaxID=3366947 RepID=UPI003744DA28
MSARVGVVVRTRKRPAFLARALADIAAQRFEDWQIVVVNDGGDPGEVDQVIAESDASAQTTVIHIAPGEGGRCIAANRGIRATDAEFVVLHDDDDRWHPDFLDVTVAELDSHPVDAGVATATEIVYEVERDGAWVESGRVRFWADMDRISLSEMLQVNRAVPISMLYRRAVHDEVGWYDESLDAVEDWEFYLRVLAKHPIGFIGERVLAYWTQRPQASGAEANSMFDLASEHRRDDQLVRDRALAEWVEREGLGLPLYLAGMEARLLERLDELDRRLNEQDRALLDGIRHEIDAHQPVMSRMRRLRSSLLRR